jgi:hypothetical protein
MLFSSHWGCATDHNPMKTEGVLRAVWAEWMQGASVEVIIELLLPPQARKALNCLL